MQWKNVFPYYIWKMISKSEANNFLLKFQLILTLNDKTFNSYQYLRICIIYELKVFLVYS